MRRAGNHWHICQQCGTGYRSYNRGTKFCSRTCAGMSRVNHLRRIAYSGGIAKKPRKTPRVARFACPVCGGGVFERKVKTCSKACGYELRKRTCVHAIPDPNYTCLECGVKFHAYTSRKFCSYACSVKNGSPIRAGAAASKSRMKYGAKKDANHREIAEALSARGVAVYDTSGLGYGFPDCIVWAHGQWHLVEIKNPKTSYGKRGLNKIQRAWLNQWMGGPVFVLKSTEDAVKFARGEMGAIETVKPAGRAE